MPEALEVAHLIAMVDRGCHRIGELCVASMERNNKLHSLQTLPIIICLLLLSQCLRLHYNSLSTHFGPDWGQINGLSDINIRQGISVPLCVLIVLDGLHCVMLKSGVF